MQNSTRQPPAYTSDPRVPWSVEATSRHLARTLHPRHVERGITGDHNIWSHRSFVRLQALAARDGWICHYCGLRLVHRGREERDCFRRLKVRVVDGKRVAEEFWLPCDGFDWPTADHVVPRSKGGSNDLSNLVLACQRCNRRKKAKSYDEFMALLEVHP